MRYFRRFGWTIASVAVLMLGLYGTAIAEKEAGGKKDQAEGPSKIKFEKLAHDFGKSLQGASLKHTFKFTNAGKSVLVIEKVKAG